jgi:hypothetical protein
MYKPEGSQRDQGPVMLTWERNFLTMGLVFRKAPLSNLSLQDSDELLAIRKILKYFPETPVEECIHIIVSPPETTATSSREQELLDRIALLEESLNKSVYGMYKITNPYENFFNS